MTRGCPRPRGSSYYDAIEPWLLDVAQPVQYVGGEPNAVTKAWDDVAVHWALSYPDTYGIGQPNQGLAILYEVLNECSWIAAERTFSVRQDMAAALRAHGIPQLTLETHRAIRDFDVLGLSLSSELTYTNVLEMLDLANIPLHAVDRGLDVPLVVAGGHCATNPEPMADFLDVVVLGDGEQAVLQLSQIVRDWLTAGRPGGRDGVLTKLAKTGQFYVPRFYDVTYAGDGTIAAVTPNRDVPARVVKHVLTDLDQWQYPKRPIVPIAETVHERYSVEIFRGCTRGCRFCQAGMITRPVRERSVGVIEAMAQQGLDATGYDEISLLSLSSADHSQISQIASNMATRYQGGATSLSLPSTRVDAFNLELAEELARNGRRTGLTFAPEGGTARLRDVINKNVSEEDLIATVGAAFEAGWRSVKLYFMCGLPTETDDDVVAIAGLAHRVIETGRRISGHRDIACTISIGAFVPKPHTPFQWVAQTDAATVDRRIRALLDAIREDRQCGRAISLRYGQGSPALLEGLLARGDRRVGGVIEAVWRAGQMFDGWREHENLDLWWAVADQVLSPLGVSIDWYTTRQRTRKEVLPWDHLDVGLARGWLWRDYQQSLRAAPLPDCRFEACENCGVCPFFDIDLDLAERQDYVSGRLPSRFGRGADRWVSNG
ncbi:MAG: TIGR03960 family B12-binding radical SAM protein [Propionibacteriaceae bacterium]|nr:TIGR03960 family B12-binding radical SAM protein [Propionibacteriaceae bacterium]